jgi:hypothetical protein
MYIIDIIINIFKIYSYSVLIAVGIRISQQFEYSVTVVKIKFQNISAAINFINTA